MVLEHHGLSTRSHRLLPWNGRHRVGLVGAARKDGRTAISRRGGAGLSLRETLLQRRAGKLAGLSEFHGGDSRRRSRNGMFRDVVSWSTGNRTPSPARV